LGTQILLENLFKKRILNQTVLERKGSTMTSKITLAPWPGRSPEPKVEHSIEPPVTDAPLTDEVRKQVLESLDLLHLKYKVGLNRLMRAVGMATDLKSIFEKRKQVPVSIIDDIARVTGMTVPELLTIKDLSLSRQIEVIAHLKEHDLVEPLRGFMVKRRSYGEK